MVYLVELNGSRPSQVAMQYVVERCRERRGGSPSEVVLLHVSPSARAAEMETGRRLLDAGRARCRSLAQDCEVQMRLAVGDRVERLAEAADEIAADCVVVGSHDATEFPRLREIGATASAVLTRMERPVIVVTGDGSCWNEGGEDGNGIACG